MHPLLAVGVAPPSSTASPGAGSADLFQAVLGREAGQVMTAGYDQDRCAGMIQDFLQGAQKTSRRIGDFLARAREGGDYPALADSYRDLREQVTDLIRMGQVIQAQCPLAGALKDAVDGGVERLRRSLGDMDEAMRKAADGPSRFEDNGWLQQAADAAARLAALLWNLGRALNPAAP